MTEKQKRFCEEYLKDLNATQAVIRAGYSPNNARVRGSELMALPEIKSFLDEKRQEMHDSTIADAKELRQTLTSIIRQQLMEDVLMVEGVGDGVTEVVHKSKKAALRDVNKSIELLAKLDGLFDDRATVNICVPIFGGDGDLED